VISGHARPTRRPGIVLRRSGGETILYDSTNERVHLVNDTAAAIWELCDGETQKDEIVVAICQLTGMLPEIVEEDVDRLLQEFVDAGLVVLEEEPA
jgi:hypothetical protein